MHKPIFERNSKMNFVLSEEQKAKVKTLFETHNLPESLSSQQFIDRLIEMALKNEVKVIEKPVEKIVEKPVEVEKIVEKKVPVFTAEEGTVNIPVTRLMEKAAEIREKKGLSNNLAHMVSQACYYLCRKPTSSLFTGQW